MRQSSELGHSPGTDLLAHALVPGPKGQTCLGLQDHATSTRGLASSRETDQGQSRRYRGAGGHPQGPTPPSEIERSSHRSIYGEGLLGTGKRP